VTRPTIVRLCGSTRFRAEFVRANFRETMAGKIVLSVGLYSHAEGEEYRPTESEKLALDELHFRKVELADEILVLDVGGHIGYSTGREIVHAKALGKRVRYLSREGK
jgi:hypothetical protein